MLKNLPIPVSPPPGSPRDRDNRYHTLLAGGAKTRLLEAFLDLRLPEILGGRGEMTAAEICRHLALDPHRGWKFLHLLAMTGLLDKEGGDRGEDDAIFRLSAEAKEYFARIARRATTSATWSISRAPSPSCPSSTSCKAWSFPTPSAGRRPIPRRPSISNSGCGSRPTGRSPLCSTPA